MGIMDKFNKMLGKDIEEEYDDYDEADEEGYYDEEPVDDGRYASAAPKTAPTQNTGVNLSGNALEMKLVKPERYDTNTVQKIADHLLSGRTVVLNLESTNKESARRLIDFLSGVVYSIEGDITRVSNNTVVIVPHNVHVSGEQLQEQMKRNDVDDDIL